MITPKNKPLRALLMNGHEIVMAEVRSVKSKIDKRDNITRKIHQKLFMKRQQNLNGAIQLACISPTNL
jgi:hypothetical protein